MTEKGSQPNRPCTMTVINRSAIASLLIVICTVGPVAAQSDRAGKPHRMAFLAFGVPPQERSSAAAPLRAFRQAMRKLGYVEGRNLVVEERWAEGRLNRLAELANELVGLEPDVIVASGAGATRAFMRATEDIPIVIAGAADPVAEGLVTSLAHPDANVTGVSVLAGREIEGKRLELLQETVPELTRVAVILDSTSRLDPAPLEEAARALGIELLLSGETESPEEFRATFSEMVRDGADAVYAPETPINALQRRLIVELAAIHRLPAIYGSREFVDAGGLMAYGPSFSEIFRRTALYVDRILNGTAPSELPVEQPVQFDLVLNLRAAKALGIVFPPAILLRADEVVR